ncbi:4-(cytidine 5'-diphospho)-2-C-methyl-D-erythritol kinase [Jannaschia donghaensis]|uniref:4-(cytidine 5'-diphospho)-2-C-methyl-D-erythritol kinase n=1 Tax=Jannaschia donghaensis TaxID=420998 RepID=UPI0006D766F0|nr:4-(cytidine 5'-diphospho)-2-C-methyl-D-erythritol kinase [Jannaschia donghaensis]
MRTGIAPAKVNLTLHVTGRRPDGYHTLDSLVAFADFGDGITIAPGDGLTVTGPFAEGVPIDDGNLIVRALRLAGVTRAVTLDKRLPHPAGIGGGSSDAATVLRLIGATLPIETVLSLGADVPVCLHPRAARMRGIGEVVERIDIPPLSAVLVNPGLAVPTSDVFRALLTPNNAPMADLPRWQDAGDMIGWLATMRNDLEQAAIAVAPGVSDVLTAIDGTGAGLTRMSGSGATCFGLYADGAVANRAAAALAQSGWWVRRVTLR